ncbi:copper resistance protein NlpE N-terminal domain-containing protein [Plesiomonas shigelloides]|uniref:copper resistance protein NlpE N-terminal domain-containing protein n=1 Tax=Plesiomonas shigelloides TaxID=703 RepID=UPI001C059886|nr:copper resistance protein NlpE N-terminal domain-containing protein [Plesiomonas shigelloides]QWK95295.1 copper resistance protein NlpE N-terminal domain-containing protein [Plesiomonas shigelloides]
MKTNNVVALSLLAVLLSGCNDAAKQEPVNPVSQTETAAPSTQAPEPVVDPAHNARNALDWSGIYQGVVPCADCEGIKTTLQLNTDDTYVLSEQYLGKGDGNRFENRGSFSWNAAGNTVQLSGQNETRQFFVGENVLFMLDMSGQRITGALADHYRLAKLTPEQAAAQMGAKPAADSQAEKPVLMGRRWELTELMGKKVPDTLDAKQRPFIELMAEGDRIHGFSGCNSFNGGYTLNADAARISFTQMAMTRMACMDAEFEQPLMQVLEQTDNYSLSGDTLTLNKARMAPLAVFKAVPAAQ